MPSRQNRTFLASCWACGTKTSYWQESCSNCHRHFDTAEARAFNIATWTTASSLDRFLPNDVLSKRNPPAMSRAVPSRVSSANNEVTAPDQSARGISATEGTALKRLRVDLLTTRSAYDELIGSSIGKRGAERAIVETFACVYRTLFKAQAYAKSYRCDNIVRLDTSTERYRYYDGRIALAYSLRGMVNPTSSISIRLSSGGCLLATRLAAGWQVACSEYLYEHTGGNSRKRPRNTDSSQKNFTGTALHSAGSGSFEIPDGRKRSSGLKNGCGVLALDTEPQARRTWETYACWIHKFFADRCDEVEAESVQVLVRFCQSLAFNQ